MWYKIARNNLSISYRPIKKDDYVGLYRIYSNKNVVNDTNWQDMDVTTDLMKEFVDECLCHPTRKTYSVLNDGKVIGVVFLHNLEKFPGWAEVGCMLNENFWNRGIMSNVVSDIIDKSKFDKFYSITSKTNEGSKKLFKKIGFNEDPQFLDSDNNISFSYIKTS